MVTLNLLWRGKEGTAKRARTHMAGPDTPSKGHGIDFAFSPAFTESAADLKLGLAQCQESFCAHLVTRCSEQNQA